MITNQADERARLKRLLPERAIELAMQNRWPEAADVNRKIIELYPSDADAYNRLGKALMEMGRYRDALATYQKAIDLDPNNVIAKKNVERLVHLAAKAPAPSKSTPPKKAKTASDGESIQPNIFIEETGKTGLTTLVNLGKQDVRLQVTAGDRVELRINGNTLEVYDDTGRLLGNVEPRLAKRIITLSDGGNRYTAAATAVVENSLSIIIRETYQHPSQRGKLSFPPKTLPTGAYRPYMREGALRYGMEDDDDALVDYDADDADTDAEESDVEADFNEDEAEEEEEES
ncbi:MAG: tetratricopeptide repeat protein [Chloroflexia bacterium]